MSRVLPLLVLLLLLGSTASAGQFDDLLRDLKEGTEAEKFKACRAIAEIGPAAAKAVPDLLGLLLNADGSLQMAAAKALEKLYADVKPAVAAFVSDLEREDPETRARAAWSLGLVAWDAYPHRERVEPLLKDPVAFVRASAAATLLRLEHQQEAALEALVAFTTDGEGRVRERACHGLLNMPEEDETAVAALIGALKDKEPSVRLRAARTLGVAKVGASKAVTALEQALRDEATDVRVWAARALGMIGKPASRVADSLVEAMLDEEKEVRTNAGAAILLLGEDAVPGLNRALRSKDRRVVFAALEILPMMKGNATRAIPAALRVLKGKDQGLKWEACRILYQVGHLDPKRTATAVKAAWRKEPNADLRRQMEKVLSRLEED